MVGDRQKALDAGCDEFDTKPIDFAGLLDKMDRLLRSAAPEGRTWISTNATLLLVDDDAMNRDALSRRLARSGYTVLTAESGQRGARDGRRAAASTRCCST